MESDHEEEERRLKEKQRRKEEKRKENNKKIKFRESGTVDPMDPASYSDCPRYFHFLNSVSFLRV